MSIRAILHVPELPEPVIVDVERDCAVLVGRTPDRRSAPGPSTTHRSARQTRTLPVASMQVSGNHVFIEHCVDGRIFVTDLGSRNGSWMLLTAHREVLLPRGDVLLELGRRAEVSGRDQGPDEAKWRSDGEYAEAVRQAVANWLERRGVASEVAVLDAGRADGRSPTFPLAGGRALRVGRGADETLTAGWVQTVNEYVHRQNELFEHRLGHGEGFVLQSPTMQEAHRRVVETGQRGGRLVLLGETGVGKGVLASCYHLHSAQAGAPFEVVRCGGVGDLVRFEASLFGARAGALPGLAEDVSGAVERADGGTVVLDEIGEMSDALQVALLRFLDTGEYQRSGDPSVRRARVRIVAATQQDIEALVEQRKVRADLWYRLAGRVVRVPPLRERAEDLEAALQRHTVEGRSAWDLLTPDARVLLRGHAWRGNFHELNNFLGALTDVRVDGACDVSACRRALHLAESTAPAAQHLHETPAPRVSKALWMEVMRDATKAWEEAHHGEPPAVLRDMHEFMEEFLKPHLVARIALPIRGAKPGTTYRDLAEACGHSDGSHIKKYLERYRQRK